MKHFLLEGEHIVPFEHRAPELIAADRQYLQQGYDNGLARNHSGRALPVVITRRSE